MRLMETYRDLQRLIFSLQMVFATPFATPKMNPKNLCYEPLIYQCNSLRLVDTTEVCCYNKFIRKGRFYPLEADFFLRQKKRNITNTQKITNLQLWRITSCDYHRYLRSLAYQSQPYTDGLSKSFFLHQSKSLPEQRYGGQMK